MSCNDEPGPAVASPNRRLTPRPAISHETHELHPHQRVVLVKPLWPRGSRNLAAKIKTFSPPASSAVVRIVLAALAGTGGAPIHGRKKFSRWIPLSLQQDWLNCSEVEALGSGFL
jgi:hypothetical protein